MLLRLRNNAGLKLLSVALAIGAWWYLRFTANPAIAARFDQQLSVPIVTTGLAVDETARFTEKEALITILSPRDNVAVRPDQVRAVLKLAGRGPGVYAVPITIIGPRLEVKTVEPASVTLQISRVAARTVPASVRFGAAIHATPVLSDVAPDRVSVGGPSEDVARVVSVRADVNLRADAPRFDEMARAMPVDARGDEVAGLTVSPTYVRVRANVSSSRTGG